MASRHSTQSHNLYTSLGTENETARILRYQPLSNPSSFRLVRILASTDDTSDLTCTLEEYDLQKVPNYVALSYCWGSYRSYQICTINEQKIQITTSLGSALRQIRRDQRSDEKLIWADAICINQDDVQEKDVQIKHMPQIYARAGKVISWLSRGGTEQHALETVQRFIDAGYQLPDDKDLAYRVYLALMRAFVSLSQADYWRRIWVMQEVCLAKEIEITTLAARVRWDPFFRALASHIGEPGGKNWPIQGKLHEYMSTHTMHLTELNTLRGRIAQQEPIPLLQALYWTRNCQATHVKDKIFALLGLTTDSWLPLQSLYYGDSLEEVEQKLTWTEMIDISPAAAIFGTPYRLDVITFVAFAAGVHQAGSPRWSPPWTDRGLWSRLRRWQLLRLDWVTLRLRAMTCLAQRPLKNDNGSLVAWGYSLGAIEHLSSSNEAFPYQRPSILHAAARGVLDELHVNDRKGTINWQPRLANGEKELLQPWPADLERYRRRLAQMIEHLAHIIRRENETALEPEQVSSLSAEDGALYTEYQEQLREFLTLGSSMAEASSVWTFQRMRFCRTSRGFMGFGLFHSVPGDIAYLVEGFSVPVILRRYGSGLTSRGFVVVGEMFTLGVMQGEYLIEDSLTGRGRLLRPGLVANEREEMHIL